MGTAATPPTRNGARGARLVYPRPAALERLMAAPALTRPVAEVRGVLHARIAAGETLAAQAAAVETPDAEWRAAYGTWNEENRVLLARLYADASPLAAYNAFVPSAAILTERTYSTSRSMWIRRQARVEVIEWRLARLRECVAALPPDG